MANINLTQHQKSLVDDELYPLLSELKWYALFEPTKKKFYAVRAGRKRDNSLTIERLHHFVIGKPQRGLVVDHINGNTLDNRRENLRIVTQSENSLNRAAHRKGRLPGTTFHKDFKKWEAQMVVAGKRHYLGIFNTELEANKAYQIAKENLSNV